MLIFAIKHTLHQQFDLQRQQHREHISENQKELPADFSKLAKAMQS